MRRGSIFHAYSEQAGKFKFGVLLNVLPPADDDAVYFVFATSQLEFYASGRFENEILRIPAGGYPCFPHETVLDFRRLPQTLTFAQLVKRVRFRH
jgi:hypothetical protein